MGIGGKILLTCATAVIAFGAQCMTRSRVSFLTYKSTVLRDSQARLDGLDLDFPGSSARKSASSTHMEGNRVYQEVAT